MTLHCVPDARNKLNPNRITSERFFYDSIFWLASFDKTIAKNQTCLSITTC